MAHSNIRDSSATAKVIDFRCLFTHDLRRKQKRWRDGKLKYHTYNSKILLYDEHGNFIGDGHWTGPGGPQEGEEIQLDRGGVIVQLADCVSHESRDLSILFTWQEKRRQETRQEHRPAETLGRQSGSKQTPYQKQHHNSHFQSFRPTDASAHDVSSTNTNPLSPDSPKRRKIDRPNRTQRTYLQSLFGTQLDLTPDQIPQAKVGHGSRIESEDSSLAPLSAPYFNWNKNTCVDSNCLTIDSPENPNQTPQTVNSHHESSKRSQLLTKVTQLRDSRQCENQDGTRQMGISRLRSGTPSSDVSLNEAPELGRTNTQEEVSCLESSVIPRLDHKTSVISNLNVRDALKGKRLTSTLPKVASSISPKTVISVPDTNSAIFKTTSSVTAHKERCEPPLQQAAPCPINANVTKQRVNLSSVDTGAAVAPSRAELRIKPQRKRGLLLASEPKVVIPSVPKDSITANTISRTPPEIFALTTSKNLDCNQAEIMANNIVIDRGNHVAHLTPHQVTVATERQPCLSKSHPSVDTLCEADEEEISRDHYIDTCPGPWSKHSFDLLGMVRPL